MRITAAFSAGQIKKELLLDTLRQALKTACFGDKIGVVLETLLDTPIFGVGADDGEEVSKKEMARRTGLSVPTVRKYLIMIDFSFSVW